MKKWRKHRSKPTQMRPEALSSTPRLSREPCEALHQSCEQFRREFDEEWRYHAYWIEREFRALSTSKSNEVD